MSATGTERWRSNWRCVSREGALHVDLGRPRTRRLDLERTIRDLPPGTAVVLAASAPAAISRCRTFASRAGIELEREYLALPSARAPAYLVEDAPATVRVFVRSVLTVPPGSVLSTPIDACLSVLRALSPWRLIRMVAPGRVVVGRRT
jgi:hypothetical protein